MHYVKDRKPKILIGSWKQRPLKDNSKIEIEFIPRRVVHAISHGCRQVWNANKFKKAQIHES